MMGNYSGSAGTLIHEDTGYTLTAPACGDTVVAVAAGDAAAFDAAGFAAGDVVALWSAETLTITGAVIRPKYQQLNEVIGAPTSASITLRYPVYQDPTGLTLKISKSTGTRNDALSSLSGEKLALVKDVTLDNLRITTGYERLERWAAACGPASAGCGARARTAPTSTPWPMVKYRVASFFTVSARWSRSISRTTRIYSGVDSSVRSAPSRRGSAVMWSTGWQLGELCHNINVFGNELHHMARMAWWRPFSAEFSIS